MSTEQQKTTSEPASCDRLPCAHNSQWVLGLFTASFLSWILGNFARNSYQWNKGKKSVNRLALARWNAASPSKLSIVS